MFQGLVFAIVAGLFIALQNIFMSRTGEKIGFWEANTLINGMGFLLALLILFLTGRSGSAGLREVNPVYVVGCLSGVVVIFSIMQGVSRLGLFIAVPLIISAQIIGSMIISRLGLFEEKVVVPSLVNIVGVLLLVVGAVLSQLR